jgi:hypothetical protein
MSNEQPYKSPDGLEPKKSNTVLIVVVVLVVLVFPALCLCGGAAAFVWTVPVERSIQIDFPDGAEAVPMTDTNSPIEAVPPIEPAPGDEPRSGDNATTK